MVFLIPLLFYSFISTKFSYYSPGILSVAHCSKSTSYMVADTKHIIHVDTSKDSACVLLSQEEVAGSIPSVEVVGSLPKTRRCQALAALIHTCMYVHMYNYTYVPVYTLVAMCSMLREV